MTMCLATEALAWGKTSPLGFHFNADSVESVRSVKKFLASSFLVRLTSIRGISRRIGPIFMQWTDRMG